MNNDIAPLSWGSRYVAFGVRDGAWFLVKASGTGQFWLSPLPVQRRRGFDSSELGFGAQFPSPRRARSTGKACGLKTVYVNVISAPQERAILRTVRPTNAAERTVLANTMRARELDVKALNELPRRALLEAVFLLKLRQASLDASSEGAQEVGDEGRIGFSQFSADVACPEKHSA